MGARRFTVKLADGRTADVMVVGISYTFECVLEARCFSAGTDHYLSLYEERRDLIEAGKLKGFYCFEPELIDEYQCELEFGPDKSAESARWIKHYMGKCFKDNKMSVQLTFDEFDGQYGITLASIVRNELRMRPMKLSKGCIRKASESRSRWNSSDFLLIKAAVSRSLSFPSGSKSCGMTIFRGYS